MYIKTLSNYIIATVGTSSPNCGDETKVRFFSVAWYSTKQ